MCLCGRKSIKEYFQKTTKIVIVSNKTFSNFIKDFLRNKSSSLQNNIFLIKNVKFIFRDLQRYNANNVEKLRKIKSQLFDSLLSTIEHENVMNDIVLYYAMIIQVFIMVCLNLFKQTISLYLFQRLSFTIFTRSILEYIVSYNLQYI